MTTKPLDQAEKLRVEIGALEKREVILTQKIVQGTLELNGVRNTLWRLWKRLAELEREDVRRNEDTT